MSLPPGFLDELRNRLSLTQVVGRKVIWDMRKSNQGKGDMWAPCPFHQEKSASFHVDDRKGFYYCFGCHAKGDAISFVKETENVGFMEAVEILAREAGMPMPARDPKAVEVADRRGKLAEVMEAAVQHYRLMLNGAGGAGARAYLERRRLSPAAQERWHIGWAPDQRNGLVQALGAKGIAPGLLVEAGLAIAPDDGGAPYDRFRGRVIFPIRDARGRAISLGGRSLDPNARAKYLNGPETALFDKGRNLFNLGPARSATGKGAPLIVAEGYMDVIALSEAGFAAAVAPLGTAVTEDQLRMMWRIHDEPVIALDGDAAGTRAALRVIDLALPMLEAGKGLRFAVLPAGMDPDDLIRAEGPAGFQRVLEAAQPMVQLLWQRETEGKAFDSPERRAGLQKSLQAMTRRIGDPLIRGQYEQALKALADTLFGVGQWKPRKAWTGRPGMPGPVAPTGNTRRSLLASTTGAIEDQVREAVVLATLLRFPGLAERFEPELERMDWSSEDHARLRNLILTHAAAGDCRAMVAADSPALLERLMTHPHVRACPTLAPRAGIDFAAGCVEEALARLQADRALRAELAEAESDDMADEGVTWRLSRASEARFGAARGPKEQSAETVIAPNGVEMDREELEQARRMLETIDFARRGRRGV